MRITLLLIILLSVIGCARTSVQRLGSFDFPPLSAADQVLVFRNASEIDKPFKSLAVITHNDSGKYQMLTLDDAILPLKEKAREVGANALIIDAQDQTYSGILSRGIHAEARAIRIE